VKNREIGLYFFLRIQADTGHTPAVVHIVLHNTAMSDIGSGTHLSPQAALGIDNPKNGE
jgi:hypothetical protein